MVSVPIDIHYIDEKIEWNWRSKNSSEYHILCNTEKSHTGLEWHWVWVHDGIFIFRWTITLKTFFRYSKGYQKNTFDHDTILFGIFPFQKNNDSFSDMYVAPFFIWEPDYTYLVVRVHTDSDHQHMHFSNRVHMKLNKHFIYKRYAGFEFHLALTLAYTTKACSFLAFLIFIFVKISDVTNWQIHSISIATRHPQTSLIFLSQMISKSSSTKHRPVFFPLKMVY